MKLSFEFEPWELKLMFDFVKSDQIEDVDDDEEDDDDAEDEQCCCDDEPAEKTDDGKDEEDWWECFAKLVSTLNSISHNGHDSDNANRSDD